MADGVTLLERRHINSIGYKLKGAHALILGIESLRNFLVTNLLAHLASYA